MLSDFISVLFIATCWGIGWLLIIDAIREDDPK